MHEPEQSYVNQHLQKIPYNTVEKTDLSPADNLSWYVQNVSKVAVAWEFQIVTKNIKRCSGCIKIGIEKVFRVSEASVDFSISIICPEEVGSYKQMSANA